MFAAAHNCNTIDQITVTTTNIAANWTQGGPGGSVNNSSILIESVWVQTGGSGPYVSQDLSGVGTCIGGIKSPSNTAGTWNLSGTYTTSDNVIIYYDSYTNPNCGGSCCGFSSQSNLLLPVQITSFAAEGTQTEVLLTWITASEQNSDRFVIQRSADGLNWQDIGDIEAAGYSIVDQHYQFIDSKPIRGNNYYRLAQSDQDGTMYYHTAVDEVFITQGENIKLQGQQLNYSTSESGGILTFHYVNGAKILERKIDPQTNDFIDLTFLQSGLYLVRWQGASAQTLKIAIP